MTCFDVILLLSQICPFRNVGKLVQFYKSKTNKTFYERNNTLSIVVLTQLCAILSPDSLEAYRAPLGSLEAYRGSPRQLH